MIKQFENIKKRPLILHKYDRDVSSAEMELNVVCLGNHELANFYSIPLVAILCI